MRRVRVPRVPLAGFGGAAVLAVWMMLAGSGQLVAQAPQTFTSTTAINTGTDNLAHTSTLAVTGANGGAVASISVKLNGVSSNGQTGASLQNAIFLLTSPSGAKFVLLGDTGDGTDGDELGDSGSGLLNATITISDSASSQAPGSPTSTSSNPWTPQGGIFTVKPASYTANIPGSTKISGASYPSVDGASTLLSSFAGTPPNGTWTLTVQNFNNVTFGFPTTPISVSSWSLTLGYAPLSPTTTTLTANPTAVRLGGTTTLTATVSASGFTVSGGTVAFYNGANQVSCLSGNAAVSLGTATCVAAFGSAGTESLTATYSGSTSFSGSSSLAVTVYVDGPLAVTAGFSPTTQNFGGTSTLSIALANSYTGAQSGVGFSSTLPTGLRVASPSGLTNTCGGTATATGTTISLSGGSVAATSSCSVSVSVTSTASGNYSYSTGGVSASPTQVTLPSATAALTVLTVPTITFTVPTHHTIDAPFAVSATSNSPGAITYSVLSGPASIGGATVTLTGAAGAVQVQASQAASGSYQATTQTATFNVVAGSVWLGNPGQSLSVFGSDGAALLQVTGGSPGSFSGPQGEAFDSAGNLWAADASGVNVYTPNGSLFTTTAVTAGGIKSPVSLAVDGNGLIWIVNGDSSISVLNGSAAAVTTNGAYPAAAAGAPGALTIDLSGNVWVTNPGTNTVTETLGVAAPVAPAATALTNGTTGVKP